MFQKAGDSQAGSGGRPWKLQADIAPSGLADAVPDPFWGGAAFGTGLPPVLVQKAGVTLSPARGWLGGF